jgi:hypothetical protein
VAIDLAALIIMSAVSESTIKSSLKMQQAANDKLLKQAEEHRSLAHKQFTEGMARMQAEQEKTILEAARIRDEYSQSAKMAHVSYDSLMKKVEDNKGPNVVSLQINCLLKRSKQYEKDLQEQREKHEEELQDKEDMCRRYKRDLERALNKNKALEKEKRDLEEHLLTGVVPPASSIAARQDSVDSSPESRDHKRPKFEATHKKRLKPEQGASDVSKTTAYTLSARDAMNLKIVSKDPLSNREKAYKYQEKAGEAAVNHEWAIQAKATKEKAEEAEADKVKADKAEIEDAKASNKYQAKAMNHGNSRNAVVPIVTKDQRNDALEIWKQLLITTKDYVPFHHCTEGENLKAVKVLRSAMSHFRTLRLSGMGKLRATHPEFFNLQEKYYIPKDFCLPEDFFREEQLDFSVSYTKRCCSLYDFYNLLSMDSPGYIDRDTRRANERSRAESNESSMDPPRSNEAFKSLRQESSAAPDITKRHVNPSFNPFIHASNQPQRQDVITFTSTNPSNLDREQRASAEKAEVQRRAPKKNAPIPSDGDETNTDGETSYLFQDKLTPAEKNRISKLETEIKRIKSRIYTPAYLKERERAINNAEFDRSAGQFGPDYLAGVPYPWYPDRGQAPLHYDVHQVESRQSVIDRIKDNNAAMCQLEYTANKGGPRGQARR